MALISVNGNVDTAALRAGLDLEGYEDVDIVEVDGVQLDVPDGVNALDVEMFARKFYRALTLDNLGGAVAGSSDAQELIRELFADAFGVTL